jgi:16S rRNA U1498 N3-methylase RsmE
VAKAMSFQYFLKVRKVRVSSEFSIFSESSKYWSEFSELTKKEIISIFGKKA